MRVYYRCTFLPTPAGTEVISVGMVAEDGRELYAVSAGFNANLLLRQPRLVEEVWSWLPLRPTNGENPCRCLPGRRHGHLDVDDPCVRPPQQIRRMIEGFLTDTPHPQLWGWQTAEEYVALKRLWEADQAPLPKKFPRFACELRQESARLGDPQPPEWGVERRDAITEAWRCRATGDFLREANE